MGNDNCRKKVLFIIPSFFRGGMENMLINVANIVSEYADVTVYNLGSHDGKMVKRLSDSIVYRSLWSPCKNVFHCGIKEFLKGNFRFLPALAWYHFHSPRFIHKKIVREHFDTEIAFFVGEPVKIVAGCPDKSVNTVMWIHNDYSICEGLYDCFVNKKKAIEGFRLFKNIVCVSENAKKAFEKVTGIGSGVVIYNYLPVRSIRKQVQEKIEIIHNIFTIVAVGRLVNAKGFDRLLNAAVRLNEERIGYQLVVVGDGIERVELEKYSKKNELNNMFFVGMKENPYPYIAQADLLVCASRYEGYNLTVAEALILGVPVMSTRCTGPVEILDNGKYGYLTENSEDGIFNGLKKIITDKALYESLKKATRDRQDFFSEDRIKAEIKRVIL